MPHGWWTDFRQSMLCAIAPCYAMLARKLSASKREKKLNGSEADFFALSRSLCDIYLLSHYYDYFNSIEQLDWQATNIEYTHLHSNTSGRRCVANVPHSVVKCVYAHKLKRSHVWSHSIEFFARSWWINVLQYRVSKSETQPRRQKKTITFGCRGICVWWSR